MTHKKLNATLKRPLRIIFMGTSDFGLPCLRYLLSGSGVGVDDQVCAVYSAPPRRSGRGMRVRHSPIHDYVERVGGIDVRTPESLLSSCEGDFFASLEGDIALVISYGLLLPSSVLSLPRLGCFNIHASLLPRWRGAAPIERAILAGDRETGVSMMRMVKKLDAGDVVGMRRLALDSSMTAGDVSKDLAQLSVGLLDEFLCRLRSGEALDFAPQNESGVCYAHKITSGEAHIDWSLPCDRVRDHIHGFSPRPGAHSYYVSAGGNHIDVRFLRCACVEEMRNIRHNVGDYGRLIGEDFVIACGEGAIRVQEVQRSGRSAMGADAFLRGAGLPIGTIFGKA